MPVFPKLWVATHFWVAKFCQVGRQSFSENIFFNKLFSKLDQRYCLPLTTVLRVLH